MGIANELRERALPDGVEWPRFEDGELVKVGDEVEFEGETMRVFSVAFNFNGWVLWCARESFDGRLCGSYGELVKRPTSKVLGADGAPIEVGDTVYLRSNGRKGEVTGFYEEDGVTWVAVSYELRSDRMTVNTECKALSHKRPDSWERLEQDAKGGPTGYARDILGVNVRMTTTSEDYEAFASDIVRRAKALAKAGE